MRLRDIKAAHHRQNSFRPPLFTRADSGWVTNGHFAAHCRFAPGVPTDNSRDAGKLATQASWEPARFLGYAQWQGRPEHVALYEAGGYALAIDVAYEPLLRGLRPVVVNGIVSPGTDKAIDGIPPQAMRPIGGVNAKGELEVVICACTGRQAP